MIPDSLRRIWSVATKELLDFVRDWRTLIALVLIPILIFPLFFIALPIFLQGEMAELDQYELNLEVQINDLEIPIELIEPFNTSKLNYTIAPLDLELNNLSSANSDALRIRDGNGQPHVILRLEETESNSSESWNLSLIHI